MAVMMLPVWDLTLPGKRNRAAPVEIDREQPVTARDLIRARVRREVERYNSDLTETFQGLVPPHESESLLNGVKVRTRRPLDWEAQFARACSIFERNGFLVLVDQIQVTSLDQELSLRPGSEVEFVKLVPLQGG